MRLRRDVDRTRVVEHRRLVREVGKLADRSYDACGVRDEIFVADLDVARRAGPPPELSGPPNLRAPLACEAGGTSWMRPRPRDHTFRHVQKRECCIAAVADEMDVLSVRKEPLDEAEVAHVHRSLVAPARLAVLGGICREQRRQRLPDTHSRTKTSSEVARRHSPGGEPGQAPDVVQELLRIDRVRVTMRQLRDEEGLVGNRDPRRAIEDDAQQRRARAADAEDEERRAHGCDTGSETTTSARSARPPTET